MNLRDVKKKHDQSTIECMAYDRSSKYSIIYISGDLIFSFIFQHLTLHDKCHYRW